MKNIFLAGGAGYCGSLLVQDLLKQDYRVTIYDTCFFGYSHHKYFYSFSTASIPNTLNTNLSV